jgi:hypothetical protein
MKLCIEKGLNFDVMIGFSTMTVFQLTGCSLPSSFWPKIDYKNGTSTSVPLNWLHILLAALEK